MPRGARCTRGGPARLACLLLLALIVVVCLASGADAKKKRPAACPTNEDGTVACNACVKKNCKFDDRCIFDKAAANSPTSPGAACQTASTKLNPDVCRGIQRKHGKNAPAIVSATGTGGKAGKRARCLASVAPQNNSTTVPCGCFTKSGKTAKRGCKFCIPTTPIVPCTDGTIPGTSQNLCPKDPGTGGDTPPPPGPPSPPSPPSPPPPVNGTDFLPGNVMTMQGGAAKYTPSTNRGNWTTLCQIPQQAKAIATGADQTDLAKNTVPDTTYVLNVWNGAEPVPGLSALYADKPTSYNSALLNTPYFMAGTQYFDNAAKWYVEGLPKDAAGKSTGGIAPATYTGTGKDYLDNYFRTGIQATPSATALSGSADGEANSQILMKTSAYWVAVTHVMYNLDMAEKNLAANNTAAAASNFDSAAAAYYGCGDTNPVPLPFYKGSVIKYSATAATLDTGFNATTMSIYGVANKRADNYGTLGFVSTTGGTCTVASTTCKKVAALNTVVAAALSGGPSTANIQTIKDSVLTIFTQAAQRYAAKLSLSANLPGNGMGGSTNPDTVTGSTNPTAGSYIPSTIGGDNNAKKQPTACGGRTSTVFTARTSGTTAIAASAGQGFGLTSCGPVVPLAANGVGCNAAGTATATCPDVGDGCRTVTGVNACSVNGNIPAVGSPESNTVTFGAVQQTVSSVTANAVAPFKLLKAAAVTAAADTSIGKGGGNTNAEIEAASRGRTTVGTATAAPIACIGPDVQFAEITTCGKAGGITCDARAAADRRAGVGLRLCVPNGKIPPPGVLAATTGAARTEAYMGTEGAPGIAANLGSSVSGFWDPVTVAMVTNGAFCCNSLVYSSEGLGRPDMTGIAKPSAFVPPMVGGNMVAETSPGGMYNGASTTAGLSAYKNPTQVNQLEGQAFYACMAPMQYTLQTTSTNAATQKIRADKQKICAETMTKMLKIDSTASASTPTATTGCVNRNQAPANLVAVAPFTPAVGTLTNAPTAAMVANAATTCRGSLAGAVQFPLWKVGIGGTTTYGSQTDYFVPSGYCYANACFQDFAEVGTQSTFLGTAKLGSLVKSPDMASAPVSASPTTGAGRANKACAAAPTGWTGAAAEFKLCPLTQVNTAGESTCTTAQIQAQTGRIPVA